MPSIVAPASVVISFPVSRAAPSIVTEREFRDSPFGEQVESSTARIADVLVAAEGMIKAETNSHLIAGDYNEVIINPNGRLFLTLRPVSQVYYIRHRGEYSSYTVVNPIYYQLQSGSYVDFDPEYGYYRGGYAEVVYRAGYEKDNFPADLKYAIFAQAALLLTPDFELYGTGDSKSPGFGYLEDRIEKIVKNYRLSVW